MGILRIIWEFWRTFWNDFGNILVSIKKKKNIAVILEKIWRFFC